MTTSESTHNQVCIARIRPEQTLPLRQKVLWPSLSQQECVVDGDEQAQHYGLFLNNEQGEKLVCVASIYLLEKEARLRKFATLTEHQGQGLGSQMLNHILGNLTQNGFEKFWCDARITAADFYQRFGMQMEGHPFLKRDVIYIRMSKVLHE